MKTIPSTYEQVEIEKKILRWWNENKILDKIILSKRGRALFRFLEGPPTVNGFMHIGHARGRAMKDIMIRYMTMQGYDVWRRGGWDTQGLPVELQVEKQLHLNSKKEIEETIGLQLFVEKCKALVDYYLDHWIDASRRLGMSLTFQDAYETRKDNYIETVWRFLKEVNDRGLLVEDFKVVPTCPRCETALSGHEVALGYATVTDPSLYIKYKFEDGQDEYIIVWTTTPWTIPGNEAVAVHPEYDYVRVLVGNEVWILALERVEHIMKELEISEYRLDGTFKGKVLMGKRYIHPLREEVPAHLFHKREYDHTVVCGRHVTLLEGTGCVHTSPAHGPEDFQMSREYDISFINPVDVRGRFTVEAGKYSGLYVKDAGPMIIEDLTNKKTLLSLGSIEHEYPLCWRCDAPLIYRADRLWFLKLSPIKKRLLDENGKLRWVPEWAGTNRFGNWLENAEDWCVSRSRIWGSPLNVWVCSSCGKKIVVGTIDQLKSHAKTLPDHFELHRPWIDEVILKCPSCEGDMKRVEHVLDCWLDSGMAHTAGIDAMRNPGMLDLLYPYDFISEGIDQTRGWFYSTIVTGIMAYDTSPYKSVLCQEFVLDKEGKKMSKSRGNVVWALESMDRVGADLLRIYLTIKNNPWDPPSFDYDEVGQMSRDLSILWNIFVFTSSYMELDNFEPDKYPPTEMSEYLKPEDKWLLSKTQGLVKATTEGLNGYYLNKPVRALLDFMLNDISRLYIRTIRRRTWSERDDPDKLAVYSTLYYVLERLIRLFAPYAPFLTEELYQLFVKNSSSRALESVHMSEWPKPEEEWIDLELENDFETVESVITTALGARQRAQLKLRWPVAAVYICPVTDGTAGSAWRLANLIKEQLNAKDLFVLGAREEPPWLQLKATLILSQAGPLFREKTQQVEEMLSYANVKALRDELSEGPVRTKLRSGEVVEITPEMISIQEIVPANLVRAETPQATIYIDTTRTPELLAESIAREIVRRVQVMRKRMSLKIDEYVELVIKPEDQETFTILTETSHYIKAETRTNKLYLLKPDIEWKSEDVFHTETWNIEGESITLSMKRASQS